jgi:hypothetical protein
MNRVFITMLLALIIIAAAGGCQSESGARQFIPGQGWVPVN